MGFFVFGGSSAAGILTERLVERSSSAVFFFVSGPHHLFSNAYAPRLFPDVTPS